MKEIASAFVKAQKSFAPALKTNTNPHFKSRYVGLDGCIEAVIDALNSNGIALLQPTHPDDTGVTVETLFVHESGEVLSGGRLHVPAAKQDPQGYGSALTYARRYSLMSACGIAPEDDDGNAASKPAPAAKPIYISGAQAEKLATLAAEVNADLPALFDWISEKAGRTVSTFSDLHLSELKPITATLEKKKATV
jgi:hypothetical protein